MPALAQTAPPRYVDVDQNGVDLVSGSYVTSVNEGSIGAGEGAVSLTRVRNGASNWIYNWGGGLVLQTSGSTTTAYVLLGAISDAFTGNGTAFTSLKGDGATLVANTAGLIQGYLYTAADGTQIQFSKNGVGAQAAGWPATGFACAGYAYTSCAIPVSLTKPNGLKFNINWNFVVKCTSGSGPTCSGGKAYYRMSGISSPAGYGLSFHYLTDIAGNFSAPQTDWYKKSTITFSNTNNPPGSVPTITYPTPDSGYPDFTDPAGRTWHFTGGNNSVLTGIQRPGAGSTSTSVSYAGSPQYVSSITRDGITTGYSRNVVGATATTTITDAQSHQTIVVADLNQGHVTSVTRVIPSGTNIVTSYAYDARGRLTEVTYPEGNKLQFGYDARGNVLTRTRKAKPSVGGADIVTTAGYDTTCGNVMTCNQPNWTKDALLNQTDFEYDPATGLVTKVTAPAAVGGATRPQVRYGYTVTSGASLLTSRSTCQIGATCAGTSDEIKTSITYNSNLLPATVNTGSGDGVLASVQTLTYDSSGNLLSFDGPLSGSEDTTAYRYNAANERVGIIDPDPDGAGALKRKAVKVTYSSDGLPTATEVGTVNGTSDADWAAFASLQQNTSTYDSNARKTKDVLTAGGTTYRVTQYKYNLVGQIECTALRMNDALWGGSLPDACTLQTAGGDGDDRITRVSYDAADRQSQITTGYGTAAAANDAVVTYNGNGTIATLADGLGHLTTYSYDGFDRLSKTQFPVATGSGSSGTDYEELLYDAVGNILSRHLRDYDGDHTRHIDYQYDHLNRLTTKDLPGSEPDVTYGYDLPGRLTSAAQSGSILTLGYDALGRQTSAAGPLGTVGYAYDLAGNRTRITWPDSYYVNYDYNPAYQVTKIRENGAVSGVGVLATYTYDDLGRRVGAVNGDGSAAVYAFDAISRLGSLTEDLSSPGDDVTFTFAYNAANQIKSRLTSNDAYAWRGYATANTAYASDGRNQYTAVGAASVTHGLRGNLTGHGADSYSYSSENLLIGATVNGAAKTLSYDPAQRLYQLNGSNTVRYLYDGSRIIGEYNGSNVPLRRFVPGVRDDETVMEYNLSGSPTRMFVLSDERGSSVALTNGAGALSGTANSYDEFGAPRTSNSGFHQYTGQAWFPELGLSYYKARVYTPKLGQFMQTNPVAYADGMNLYNYVGSDPVNKVDPSGLDGIFIAHCKAGMQPVPDPRKDAGFSCVPVPGVRTPNQPISDPQGGVPGGGPGGSKKSICVRRYQSSEVVCGAVTDLNGDGKVDSKDVSSATFFMNGLADGTIIVNDNGEMVISFDGTRPTMFPSEQRQAGCQMANKIMTGGGAASGILGAMGLKFVPFAGSLITGFATMGWFQGRCWQ